jgi:hypothetical protein
MVLDLTLRMMHNWTLDLQDLLASLMLEAHVLRVDSQAAFGGVGIGVLRYHGSLRGPLRRRVRLVLAMIRCTVVSFFGTVGAVRRQQSCLLPLVATDTRHVALLLMIATHVEIHLLFLALCVQGPLGVPSCHVEIAPIGVRSRLL